MRVISDILFVGCLMITSHWAFFVIAVGGDIAMVPCKDKRKLNTKTELNQCTLIDSMT